jgi:hypothetical protein
MATFREKRNKKEEELDREKKETGILFYFKKPAVTRTQKKSAKKLKKSRRKFKWRPKTGEYKQHTKKKS